MATFDGLDDAAAAYLGGQAASTASQIRQNLGDAVGSNPDQEAQLQRAAAATVTPMSTARALPQVVTQQAQAQGVDAAQLTQKFPNLARFLTSPDNTRLVHDDLPATAAVEQHVQALGSAPAAPPGYTDPLAGQSATPLPQTFRQRIEASVRGFLGMPEAGMDPRQAAEANTYLAARAAGQTPEQYLESTQTGASALTNIVRQFGQHFGSSFTAGIMQPDVPEASGTGQAVAGGIGELLGFLGGGSLKVGTAVAERALPQVLERAVGDSFVKALGKDVTRQAAVLGLASGVQSAGKALDTTSGAEAATVAGKGAGSGAAMGAIFGAAGRVLPENTVAQTVARIVGVNAAMDVSQGTSPWDNRSAEQKVFDYALDTFFAARGAGKVGGSWLHDAAAADLATHDANVLGGLAATATASKLRERSPDAFRAFVGEAANDGPVPAVYVDGTRLAEALAQSKIGTDELDNKLPALRGQLEQALATGGQVRIPVEDFATHIAGGPLEAPLLEHLRTDPEGMSKAEADTFYQTHTEQLKADAERISAEQAQNQPFVDSQQKVHDQVLGQLGAANRFRPEVNQAYAAMTRDWFTTMSGRAGLLPHELFEKYPLTVGAEGLTGALEQPVVPDEAFARMLDWDKPYAEQPKVVKEALKSSGLYKEYRDNLSDFASPQETRGSVPRGQYIYQFLAHKFGGQEAASKALAALGIPGIKYHDASSRDAGKGTHNVVVFDQNVLDEMNKSVERTLFQSPKELPPPSERADDLRAMGRAAYWAEEGGKLLRAPLEDGGGMQGEVTGRTQWIPAVEWFGEMRRVLGRNGLTTQPSIARAIEKAIAGEPLNKKEQATVDYMRQEAELMRQQVGRYAPEAPELVEPMLEEGLQPADAELSALMLRAREADPEAFDKATDEAFDRAEQSGQYSTGEDPALIETLRGIVARADEAQSNGPGGEQGSGSAAGQAGNRGAFSPDSGQISLLKGADLSTFLHESGHFFLDTLSRMAAEPGAPESIRADAELALKWMGHEGDVASWRALPLEAQREGHEQFARGFEAYLMEGKAPSLELRALFSRFRSWLLNVYQSLRSLKVHLTPEVRGVFDRMLASESAIQQAEAARSYVPMPELSAKAGMSPEDYQAYHALGAEATQRALDELGPKTLHDLAWSDRVRSTALKDLAKDAAEKRKAVRQEVEAEVDKEPVYAAMRFLKRGETLDAKGEPQVSEAHRFNLADMKAIYPEGSDVPWQNLGYGKYGMLGEKGLHPDLVAEQFGFPSADALIRTLLAAPPRRELIQQGTEQRMLERHGEVATPEALARAADDAVHNDIRARYLATEMKALTKAVGPAREIARAAKDVAAATVDARHVRDISERPFLSAETRAAKAVREALKKDDLAKAAVASRDQLLNNALVRSSLDAQKAVTKGLAYLKRFDRAAVREKIDVDIRDQIDALLERFDLRQAPATGPTRPQQNLRVWMESQEAAGYSPAIPRDLLDPVVRQHFKDMPVELFKGLVDSVKALEHVGKERRTLTIAGQKQDLAAYVADRLLPKIAETGRHFSEDQLLEKPADRHSNDIAVAVDHFGSWLRGAAAQLKPQEFKRNQYDRHELLGPFGEAIFEPVIEANYRKVTLLKDISGEFQKAADELGREWQDSLKQTMPNTRLVDPDKAPDENGNPQMLSMKRGRMLGIAIHVGNESNFAKLTKGWGWEPETVWRFLHENMTAKDWQGAETVWRLYDRLWPDMEAMNRRLGNTMPERIEPRAFKTEFGESAGGYAAISYDPLRSRRGEKDEQGRAIDPQQGLFGRDYFRADTTTNGSMNARVEGYNDRVDLDFHTIARKLNESVHDLAYRETLIDVNKVLEQPDFRRAFRAAYGREAYHSMQEWIGRLANSNTIDQQVGALGKFLQYTRTGMVINAIAFRATTVLKHGGSAGIKTTGYFVGGGEKYLASRMASMGTDYKAQIEGAKEKFGEIRNRLSQQDRDFRATSTTLFEPDANLAKLHRLGHAAVAWSDMLTAVPTAWAAYDRAIVEGIPKTQGGTGKPLTEAQAVAYANKILREAHGSTAEAARSMILNTNSEAMKMFTTLFGFMNNSYGQQLDGFDKLRTSGITNGPVLARTFMAIIVPALWAAYLTHGGAKDQESWAGWVAKAIGAEVASSLPFVRDAVAMAEGYQHAGQVAVESWVATLVKAGQDVGHIVAGDGKGKPIKEIANAVGMGLHIPGLGQAGQSAQYVLDVRSGKQQPHSSYEYAKGVVLGHGEPMKH